MYHIIRRAASIFANSTAVIALAVAIITIHVALALIINYVINVRDGGVSTDPDSDGFFNMHPLLMGLAFLFFMPEAILVYRVFTFLERPMRKYIHFSFQTAAFICVSWGLYIKVKDVEDYPQYPSFYTPHAPIGVIAIGLFYLQYAFGLFTYLLSIVPPEDRGLYSPFHKFIGITTLAMGLLAIAIAMMIPDLYTGTDPQLKHTTWIAITGSFTIIALAVGVFHNNPKPKGDLLIQR